MLMEALPSALNFMDCMTGTGRSRTKSNCNGELSRVIGPATSNPPSDNGKAALVMAYVLASQ